MLREAASNEFVRGKPILVLANKQDLPSALPEVDISMRLGLQVRWSIVKGVKGYIYPQGRSLTLTFPSLLVNLWTVKTRT